MKKQRSPRLVCTPQDAKLYVVATLRVAVFGAEPINTKLGRNRSFVEYTKLNSSMEKKGKCVFKPNKVFGGVHSNV